MTGESTMPRCEGCGFRFRDARGDRFCSMLCAGAAAQSWMLAGLRKYAEEHPPRVG